MNATLMSRSFWRRVSKLKAETLPQTFSLDDKGNKKNDPATESDFSRGVQLVAACCLKCDCPCVSLSVN